MGRSPVVSPPLPPLNGRIDRFDMIVASTADYLRDAWEELRDVQFGVAGLPPAPDDEGIPRWKSDRERGQIVIYRIPVERLNRMHRHDELHTRMIIEGIVFRAAAEYLDRDPWELSPDRHDH